MNTEELIKQALHLKKNCHNTITIFDKFDYVRFEDAIKFTEQEVTKALQEQGEEERELLIRYSKFLFSSEYVSANTTTEQDVDAFLTSLKQDNELRRII